jgi:hypothetical protein
MNKHLAILAMLPCSRSLNSGGWGCELPRGAVVLWFSTGESGGSLPDLHQQSSQQVSYLVSMVGNLPVGFLWGSVVGASSGCLSDLRCTVCRSSRMTRSAWV